MAKPNLRILILDDMTTMRRIVSKTLKECGYTDILEAADGVIGWELLQSSNPKIDLIISDWNMPNMTGFDLLKKIRVDNSYAAVPFILLTAESESAQVAEAVKLGVSNYIVKPFSPDMLKQKLEATFQRIASA